MTIYTYVTIYATSMYLSMEMQTMVTASTVCHRCDTTSHCNVLKVQGGCSFSAVTRTAPGWGTLRC